MAKFMDVHDGFFGVTKVVYPRLPGRMRDVVKDHYLNDLRRRLARRRNPLTADGR